MKQHLLSFGHGYSARALTPHLLTKGWKVTGTTRDPTKLESLRDTGVDAILWDRTALIEALGKATHILISVAPGSAGDPVLRMLGDAIAARAPALEWVGYLSTTGVYGNMDGAWISEDAPLTGATERGKARIAAEAAWQATDGLPLHIFRLAGIYGPGRGPFEKIRRGTARRVIKEGQVFSRIHVEDIAQVLLASIAQPNPGAAYNVSDGEPAPPQDVLMYAARLLGVEPPPEVAFDEAEMSPMARSFYAESKRVSNRRILDELKVNLRYPGYEAGLRALLADSSGR